jgi:hypothetical protein
VGWGGWRLTGAVVVLHGGKRCTSTTLEAKICYKTLCHSEAIWNGWVVGGGGGGGIHQGDGRFQAHVVPNPGILCVQPEVAVDFHECPATLDGDWDLNRPCRAHKHTPVVMFATLLMNLRFIGIDLLLPVL